MEASVGVSDRVPSRAVSVASGEASKNKQIEDRNHQIWGLTTPHKNQWGKLRQPAGSQLSFLSRDQLPMASQPLHAHITG